MNSTVVALRVLFFPLDIPLQKFDRSTGTVYRYPNVGFAKCEKATNNTWNINPILRDIEVPMEKLLLFLFSINNKEYSSAIGYIRRKFFLAE